MLVCFCNQLFFRVSFGDSEFISEQLINLSEILICTIKVAYSIIITDYIIKGDNNVYISA